MPNNIMFYISKFALAFATYVCGITGVGGIDMPILIYIYIGGFSLTHYFFFLGYNVEN